MQGRAAADIPGPRLNVRIPIRLLSRVSFGIAACSSAMTGIAIVLELPPTITAIFIASALWCVIFPSLLTRVINARTKREANQPPNHA